MKTTGKETAARMNSCQDKAAGEIDSTRETAVLVEQLSRKQLIKEAAARRTI